MKQVKGKHILLMSPQYYGYEKYLLDALSALGAKVTFIENRAFQYDPINKGTAWYERLFCRKNTYLHEEILPEIQKRFDLYISIDLFSFHPSITQTLRKHNSDIQCLLYLWDNVRGYKWIQFFTYFDHVLSFDPVEAAELNIKYFPNFYPSTSLSENTVYDLYFVGSLQVHRLELLNQLSANLKKQNKSAYFFYLYLPQNHNRIKYNAIVYFLLKLFPKQFRGYKKLYELISRKVAHEFVFHEPLELSEAIKKMSQSKCIIDLPFPGQTGSTQRVVQALALNKKVITTNSSVEKDSFYSPDYIKIISESNLLIDWNWIDTKNNNPADISYLQINNWLVRLLSHVG
jgi:hypothetical protein